MSYGVQFALMVIVIFVVILTSSISAQLCSDDFTNMEIPKPTGNFIIDAVGSLGNIVNMLIVFVSPCSGGLGWMSIILLIPIGIVLLLTIISHIPVIGRGG